MEFLRSNIDESWMDLVEEFPEIFLDPSPYVLGIHEKYGPVTEEYSNLDNLCNLRFSFECGIGWKNLIREFCVRIRALVQLAKSERKEIHYKSCIMKEKFGELRDQGDFYGPDAAEYRQRYYDISEDVEEKSRTICEVTGNPGKRLLKGGWTRTLCEEEALKRGYHWD